MEEVKEVWTNLFIDEIKEDNYVLISMKYDCEGLIIVLEGDKYKLTIDFGLVNVFRNMDEGACLEIYEQNEVLHQFRRGIIKNPFFRVTNSKFLKEIGFLSGGGEGGGFYNETTTHYKHYSIVTMNEVIDVVNCWEPEIEIKEAD